MDGQGSITLMQIISSREVRRAALVHSPMTGIAFFTVNCPQCLGFWVGLFGGLLYADLLMVPLYAGAVSLLSVLADRLGT